MLSLLIVVAMGYCMSIGVSVLYILKKTTPARSLAIFIFLLILNIHSYGQSMLNISPPSSNGQTKDFMPASPTAASLGIFGQIPVGNYTGTANVSVPLYNINYRDLNIPIGISYHAAGNKPDFFPGLTGLSWTLNAGGSVTRVVKGMPDYEKYEIGSVIIPVGYNPTGESDWNTLANLNEYLTAGGFYTDQDRTNPDEFYFNFNGITGKFYMNHLSSFTVKSESNRFYNVEAQVMDNKNFTMPLLTQDPTMDYIRQYQNIIRQPKVIYKITITDDHGIKYIFGGTDNSIEFSRPGHSYSSHNMATIDYLITPMTWHLTAIESPNGYSITLDYERGMEVTKVGYSDITKSTWQRPGQPPAVAVSPLPVAMSQKSTLVNVCYPKSITTPREKVLFTTSEATEQLQFPTDPTIYQQAVVTENMFNWYGDIGRVRTQNLRSRKLDKIEVRDIQDHLNQSIYFEYTNNTNTRLKLLGVKMHGNDDKSASSWGFEYNQLSLPPYLSYKTDHYGFYNGRNPYITTSNTDYYINTLDQQAFFNSKEPDPAYVQAELLNKVIYPTGGFTVFEYEPHQYSSTVQTWPFTTVAGTNRTTGGVRIKKITDYTATGQQAFSKQYYYVKNYLTGGTTSSGVLAWQPTYYENISGNVVPPAHFPGSSYYTGTIDFKLWSSNPIFPMGATRGNHVTYSEVTEVYDNGGSVVYKYKNYDNGYNDQLPVQKVSDNTNLKEFWKEEEGISMDIERGQSLSEEYYDAAKVLKKKKEYQYNDDPARFDNNVRVLAQTFNSINRADIRSVRITASLIYTYFPFLKKLIETDYESNGQSLVTTVNYEYDASYRMVKTVKNNTSDGRLITTINKFPADMVSAGVTAPYNNMVTKGMVGMLISTEQQSDGVKLTTSSTDYAEGLSGTTLILPQAVKTQYKNNIVETKVNYLQYDVKGNVTSSSIPGGITTCFIWSYNYTYPVAKIANADYATVLSVLGGQEAINGFAASIPSNNDLATFLQPLRTAPALSAARICTYTYHLLNGMTSETDPNNRSTFYEYDFMGRLNIVRDQDGNILRKICYNYAGQIENCGVGPAYDRTVFAYTTNNNIICNPNAILQVIDTYSKKMDPEALVLHPDEFFMERTFATHPPDGYYKVISSDAMSASNRFYYYISNGRIVNTYLCP